jgi:hypothetical protein
MPLPTTAPLLLLLQLLCISQLAHAAGEACSVAGRSGKCLDAMTCSLAAGTRAYALTDVGVDGAACGVPESEDEPLFCCAAAIYGPCQALSGSVRLFSKLAESQRKIFFFPFFLFLFGFLFASIPHHRTTLEFFKTSVAWRLSSRGHVQFAQRRRLVGVESRVGLRRAARIQRRPVLH